MICHGIPTVWSKDSVVYIVSDKLRYVTYEFYKAKKGKKNWQWRLPFRTKTVCISDDLSKKQIFEKLDECYEEIQNFERDLKNKLSLDESAKA